MLPWRAFGGSTAPPTPRFGPPASRTMKKSILLFADTKCAIICYGSPRDLTQPPRPQFTHGAAPRGPHLPIPPRLTGWVAPGARTSRSPLRSHGAAPWGSHLPIPPRLTGWAAPRTHNSRSPLGSHAGRPLGPAPPGQWVQPNPTGTSLLRGTELSSGPSRRPSDIRDHPHG